MVNITSIVGISNIISVRATYIASKMNQVQVDSAPIKNWTPLDEPTLVSQLNALLTSLHIPILLISPTDLTPRLLIAILESILGMRVPVLERQDDSQVSKVQNIKIFLGVLETDILQADVGLSRLDPRRLARGERDDVVFIAELLCWIGRRMKLIKHRKKASANLSLSPSQLRELQPSTVIEKSRRDSSSKPAFQLDLEEESAFRTGSTWTEYSTLPTNSLFASRPFDDESFTNLNTDDHPLLQPPFNPKPMEVKQTEIQEDDAFSSVSDILDGFPETLNPRQRDRPRCIHEILPSPPSVLVSHSKLPLTPPQESGSSFSRNWSPDRPKDSYIFGSPIRSPSVRYSGYIEAVDEESEIASFELNRSISTTSQSERSFDVFVQVGKLSILFSCANAECPP